MYTDFMKALASSDILPLTRLATGYLEVRDLRSGEYRLGETPLFLLDDNVYHSPSATAVSGTVLSDTGSTGTKLSLTGLKSLLANEISGEFLTSRTSDIGES